MGYWGFATKENKLAWTLIAVFSLLGVAFWIPGVLQYRRCVARYNQCACPQSPRGVVRCLNLDDPEQRNSFFQCRIQLHQCRRTPIIIWSLGWLFLAGFSWLPCFYFCCCAKEPPPAYAPGMYAQNGVQMATGQTYGPGAHYTTHPFAAQPVGPMPYYAGMQQQQPCPPLPYPPQPPMGYPVNGTQQQQQQQQGGAGGPGSVPVRRY